jgi:hypothetical protein
MLPVPEFMQKWIPAAEPRLGWQIDGKVYGNDYFMRELQDIISGNSTPFRISATLKLIADIKIKYSHIVAGKWPRTPEAKARAGFDYFANNIKALTIDCNPT